VTGALLGGTADGAGVGVGVGSATAFLRGGIFDMERHDSGTLLVLAGGGARAAVCVAACAGRRWRLDCWFFEDLSLRADAVATKRELAACTDGEAKGLGSVRVLLWHFCRRRTGQWLALLAVSDSRCVKARRCR